jgi:hypothetical protein
MTPGTVVHLVKSISTRSGGMVATYKLVKNASISVLVLPRLPSPAELAKINEILK